MAADYTLFHVSSDKVLYPMLIVGSELNGRAISSISLRGSTVGLEVP